MPITWNGDLVVYAHGYVATTQPVALQNLTLADGTSLPGLVQALGYAFATTSYRANGLVVLEGVDDLRHLIAAFDNSAPTPRRRTLVTGASEGALIATLLTERYPDLVSGTLAACGPIGDFRAQIDYVGDFRVLFDYFFPSVLPGSPTEIPSALLAGWDSTYAPRIAAALNNDPARALELMRVSHAAIDPPDVTGPTVTESALALLWYNVFGTNDAAAKLGGNPFSNHARWYSGSTNDLRLNLLVRRVGASSSALVAMRRYQTSARLARPVVTLHTTADPVVPVWQSLIYWLRADTATRGQFTFIPTARYGHCSFTASELLTAFFLLALRVNAAP